MTALANKKVIVGISGGIAAYKSIDLVRQLKDAGAEVRVIMTRGAAQFVTPLSLQSVAGNPVHQELMDPAAEQVMSHIELARWADLIVIAPATAHLLAKLAHGMADDLLTTVALATLTPILIAPAMNTQMWLNPATQANYQQLNGRGVEFIGPDSGDLACGEVGPGRMVEPVRLVEHIQMILGQPTLAGCRVLLTAGPTREPIDPVRYITNRSSGKMGYAIAAAAVAAGAEVTLVSGPTALPVPLGVDYHQVETAAEMARVVSQLVADCDLFIATAAVADYAPAQLAVQKIKKGEDSLSLVLSATEDILRAVTSRSKPPFTVGFAAETDQLRKHALGKLESKSLDMIVANRVGPSLGFERDEGEVEILWEGGEQSLPLQSKLALARKIIALVSENYNAKGTSKNS